MKIISIIGARPQFIKYAPLSKELRKAHNEILIHTGQHYDDEMSELFFRELKIPEPNYNLNVGSGSHGEQTGEISKRIESVLMSEKPDFVLVYGDTNSTLAGALAAVKLHIKIGHVEAGLRSYDRNMAEEINRVLTDLCSDILFAPTKTAVENLKREGIIRGVYLTGDVMVDALNANITIAKQKSRILDFLEINPKEYCLTTVHRAENSDDFERLRSIVDAFCESETLMVFPCHPRTEKMLKIFRLWNRLIEKVNVIKPVGYCDMLVLEKNAEKIITDSGGVQKEAYILKVPCITLRDNTEWVETVKDRWNILVETEKNKIVDAINSFTPNSKRHKNRYGDGTASIKIRDITDRISNSEG